MGSAFFTRGGQGGASSMCCGYEREPEYPARAARGSKQGPRLALGQRLGCPKRIQATAGVLVRKKIGWARTQGDADAPRRAGRPDLNLWIAPGIYAWVSQAGPVTHHVYSERGDQVIFAGRAPVRVGRGPSNLGVSRRAEALRPKLLVEFRQVFDYVHWRRRKKR